MNIKKYILPPKINERGKNNLIGIGNTKLTGSTQFIITDLWIKHGEEIFNKFIGEYIEPKDLQEHECYFLRTAYYCKWIMHNDYPYETVLLARFNKKDNKINEWQPLVTEDYFMNKIIESFTFSIPCLDGLFLTKEFYTLKDKSPKHLVFYANKRLRQFDIFKINGDISKFSEYRLSYNKNNWGDQDSKGDSFYNKTSEDHIQEMIDSYYKR